MSYVRFYSSSSFTLGTNGNAKKWNGTDSNAMEYSTDASTWTAWAGTSALTAVLDSATNTYNIYLRGTGNTKLTTASGQQSEILTYVFTGDGLIDCEGTIESLFDYATVDNNQHPTMANNACVSIFYNQTTLRTPPELSSPNLSAACYARMFMGCTALTQIPALPATTLVAYCYSNMFKNCSSLTTVLTNALPATTAVDSCYRGMFANCTSLTTPPELPATTVGMFCYYYMFENCTSLLIAPNLPASTLSSQCYKGMFTGCSALTAPSIMSATTLAVSCCEEMYSGCSSLKVAPTLPATTLANNCYAKMFMNCASITIPPVLPATTLYGYCYSNMFQDSGIKLSTTQHDDYTLAYRIPSEGTGTTASNALQLMFYGSGVNTPEINTTYYVKDAKYATYESELISIANAIRTKAKTSSILDYPEDFITAINNIQTGGAIISTTSDSHGGDVLTITTTGNIDYLQSKTVTPSGSSQTITPDDGYDGLSEVILNAIPSASGEDF